MMILCLLFSRKIGGLVEYILNSILEEDIHIQDLFIQKEFMNPDEAKKSIIVDVYALDTNGNSYCLEIQNDLKHAPPQRLRFYCSMSDLRLLNKGSKDFRELKKNTVIFLCARDKYKVGKPKYPFTYKGEDSDAQLKDGSRLIYVNGEYNGNHPIADIVHDMKCSHSEDCRLQIFKETLTYYKKEGGDKDMCEKVQKFVEKKALEMRDQLEKEVREKVTQKVTDEVTQKVRHEDEQNRLFELKRNVLSLMSKLKISLENAMELLDMNQDDRNKMMQIM